MSEPTDVPLLTPITAYGAEVSTLQLRRASAEDARLLGALPYTVTESQMPSPNTTVCAKYIMRLCNIPMSAVDQIHPVDFNKLSWMVTNFFLNADSET